MSTLVAVVVGCATDPPTVIPDGGPLCASGRYWAQGDHGDNFMHPGRACIRCHGGRHQGPLFTVAGTVFNDLHEEDECNGNAGDPRSGLKTWIEVTDSTGRPFVIEPNRSGNFYTTHAFRFPLQHVRAISPSGVASDMSLPPPSGDCNSCHTQAGTTIVDGGESAPGRIIAPNGGR